MISIIIPTCNYTNLLPCIASIRKYTDLRDTEIIVVANGYEGEIPMGVIPIWYKERIGYPKAVNRGIQQSRGEFIVLLNDDTILLPQPKNQWIDLLRAPFYDQNMAITGPWMMRNTEIERDFVCFFCCMIRKSVLDKIGLLDSKTFCMGYSEDVDLCCRAVDAGFNIAQVPTGDKVPYDGKLGLGEFPIYHKGNETFKDHPDADLIHRNHAILRERYGGVIIANAQKLGEWISDPELRWLGARAQKSNVVIELGSWFGKSAMVIADNLPNDGVLYCVDTWLGSAAERDTGHAQAREMDGDFAYNEFCKNLWRHIQSGKLRTIRMHGVHAAKLLRDMGVKADMIFIDAGHLYAEVKEDVLSYLPLLKDGGTICGHDYARPEWMEVKTAVDEVFGYNVGCSPGTTIWSTDKPPRNVYECIMFGNELDMLERNLKTMWDVVDRFIITEAIVTHSGKPKLLNFNNNLERFADYLSKITYIVVEDSPQMNGSEDSAWQIERHQREACMRAMTHCRDTDIVVVVDCDEIPNPESVKNFNGELSALSMDLYVYNHKVKAVDKWRHGKIMPYRQLKLMGPNIARYRMDVPDVVPGGEHLSYFGGVESIQEKIHNTAHRNIDTPQFTDEYHIRRCIERGLDLFGRDIKYEVVA